MAARVGIDIGGTFTDLAALDLETGAVHLLKVRSTPANLADGALAALAALGEAVPPADVTVLAHGTTAATNALIEGTAARTALLTTEGFRDLLEIARQQRPSLYDLRARKPRPLVRRRLRRGLRERMQYDGAVLHPLDHAQLERELEFLRGEQIEALAICFLHSYANPAHERAARDRAAELLPGVYITASADLLPRFREYERLSTTVINACVGPLMNGYLDEFQRRLSVAGVKAVPHMMQSNGGTVPLAVARRIPVSAILSGPAAGAAAAAHLCTALGLDRAIAIDMGGTSTDVCLLREGQPAVGSGRTVGGYEVGFPGVDVRCIGAGGGSILAVDRGGLPTVGPRSAGAEPGPACYGRGGEAPTVTDACLVLGRLGSAGLVGGAVPLDRDAAHAALARAVAHPLGISVERAALGAVELTVANIRRAVEGITVAEGHDPRDFALIAAGGAAPLIAAELADELDLREVIVPRWPGAFSAFGLLVSDLRRDWVATHLLPAVPEHLAQMTEAFTRLEHEAARWFEESGVPRARRVLLRRVAARYAGQDYELEVEVRPGQLGPRALRAIVRAFHRGHEQRYGYALPEHPVEFVNFAVTAIGQAVAWHLPPLNGDRGNGEPSQAGERLVFLGGHDGLAPCPVYDRQSLTAGTELRGPAIIEQYDSTTYLPPGFRAQVDEVGNVRVTRMTKR